MDKRNYQKELDKVLEGLDTRPSLLLHSCCGPCSSYVLSYLCRFFDVTLFYYNPNIYPTAEYDKRLNEQLRLVGLLNDDLRKVRGGDQAPVLPAGACDIRVINGTYDPKVFERAIHGLEDEPEGGRRCHVCYELRMREAAYEAKKGGYDYFATTLSVSPHKNADWINEIGSELEAETGVKHLPSDFKKREGYKRSIELSKEYGLYRQDYCGCAYSLKNESNGTVPTDSLTGRMI
ncbi:MAG: epoxyqueuosine reductase QueH [Lachnospiraceae bacterium]|nr:epoxyqueuosine reductase QueH [Lachnospiraceae bacterium]